MELTKELIEQYEETRASGICNMYDFDCVIRTADEFGLDLLVDVTRKDYVLILKNYSRLIDEFEIERR